MLKKDYTRVGTTSYHLYFSVQRVNKRIFNSN